MEIKINGPGDRLDCCGCRDIKGPCVLFMYNDKPICNVFMRNRHPDYLLRQDGTIDYYEFEEIEWGYAYVIDSPFKDLDVEEPRALCGMQAGDIFIHLQKHYVVRSTGTSQFFVKDAAGVVHTYKDLRVEVFPFKFRSIEARSL